MTTLPPGGRVPPRARRAASVFTYPYGGPSVKLWSKLGPMFRMRNFSGTPFGRRSGLGLTRYGLSWSSIRIAMVTFKLPTMPRDRAVALLGPYGIEMSDAMVAGGG